MTGRHITQRPEVLQGVTNVLDTGSGRVHVTVNCHEQKPFEVFVHFGHAGSEERALTEALGRLCSTSLQHGVPLDSLARQLRGISSELVFGFGPNKVLSVADAVGRVLGEHAQREETDGQGNTEEDSGSAVVVGERGAAA